MLYEAFKRLSKHSLIYAVGPAVHKVAGFALIPLVTGYVGGTANYGVLDYANVVIVIAAQLLGVNLLHGMSKFFTRYDEGDDRAALVTTTMTILGITSGIAMALALVFATPLAAQIMPSVEDAPVLRLAMVILFFQLNGQVGMRYLQLREMSATYGGLQIVKLILEIVLKIVFMVGLGLEHYGALYSVLVGEILISLGLTSVILTKLRYQFRWDMAKRIVKFSAPLIVSGLSMFALHQADRYVIKELLTENDLGLYGLAYKFGSMVNALMLQSFGLIWFPYIFSIHDEGRVIHLCRKFVTYFVLLITGTSLACALFAREFVVVLVPDPAFHEAWKAIPILLGGYCFWAMCQLLQTGFFVKERTGYLTMLTAGAAVINVVSNLLIVPRLGYIGAAWTTLGSFAVLAAAAYLVSERLLPVRYEVGRLLSPVFLAAGLYGLSRVIPVQSPWLMVPIKGAILAAFPVALFAFGFFNAKERSKLRALWRLGNRMVRRWLKKKSRKLDV